jgi:ABC-type phosphate transport system ATPase subunit
MFMNQDSQFKILIEDLSFFYGDIQVLDRVTLAIQPNQVFGLMGPAKSGKSTLLRVLNRMCDLVPGVRVVGGVGGWADILPVMTWCSCTAAGLCSANDPYRAHKN